MNKEAIIIDTGIDSYNCEDLFGKAPYYCKAYAMESKPGYWNTNRMVIIERYTEKEIGEYHYGYSNTNRTFHPFKLRGKWYALYSKNYTATRIMSLPDCKDLGGGGEDAFGFCPVDFWVPGLHYLDENDLWVFPDRIHGFVAGCVWGDDSDWKIQYLDLSRADEGILKREERFGHILLPSHLTLDKAIHLRLDDGGNPHSIGIDVCKYFNFETGKMIEW